jgi:hypothetical protein
MKCKLKLIDEVYAVISGLSSNDLRTLYDRFGFYVEGHRFIPAVQMGRWDGKKRYVDQHGKTYIRLLNEIVPVLIEMRI